MLAMQTGGVILCSVMRQPIVVAVLAVVAALPLGLPAATSLTGACRNGGAYPNGCVGGEVVFTGPNYPDQVRVKVTNSTGDVIDDGDYTTKSGVLTFTENLSFADTYSVSINGQIVLTVNTAG